MRKDVLLVFAAVGVMWAVVAGVIMRDAVLPGIAALYVVLGSVLLARAGERMPRMLNVLWALAVLIWFAVLLPITSLGLAAGVGAVMGSLLFGVWTGPSLMILQFLKEGRRDVLR